MLVSQAGERAETANIRNPNTRVSYATATQEFYMVPSRRFSRLRATPIGDPVQVYLLRKLKEFTWAEADSGL